jgi:hypothetical protein
MVFEMTIRATFECRLASHEQDRPKPRDCGVLSSGLYVVGGSTVCPNTSVTGSGDARRICRSLARGTRLHAFHCGHCAGAHSCSARGMLGLLDFTRNVDRPASDAPRKRFALPGRVQSPSARLPYFHDRHRTGDSGPPARPMNLSQRFEGGRFSAWPGAYNSSF